MNAFSNAVIKDMLRKRYLSERGDIDIENRAHQENASKEHLLNCHAFQNAQHIAVYLPFKTEFNVNSIIDHALQLQKKCYAPIITDRQYSVMNFEQIAKEDDHFVTIEEKTQQHFDLMIIPIVAFDKNKNRIGMGGGYYDRFISQFDDSNKPYLLGVAYQEQLTEHIPTEAWDQPLDSVLTANGFI